MASQRTKVLIMTSIDDEDEEKLLSLFNPKKRFSDTLIKTEKKNRPADLTCVICAGRATGYNFDQITCESCKAFFRRNAFHPIAKTKCLNPGAENCVIRFDQTAKCQRCRLIKCLQAGMRRDHIVTPEEKHSKEIRLEENRRRGSSTSSSLSAEDWSRLQSISSSYLSACQSSPSASSVVSLELGPDKISAYMNTLDIQNYAAMKLINFLREIPEFLSLDERDRLILVKYNLTLLFVPRFSLTYDVQREMVYDEDQPKHSFTAGEEAFAQHCKSLFILCYGYEFNRSFVSVLRRLSELIDRDPLMVELLMLTMIFLKGLAGNDDREPLLTDDRGVFLAHSKFADLLFRYLIDRSSFAAAAMKMMHIVEVLIKIQRVMRDFQQYIKTKIDIEHVNPLMKSLLNLT